VTVRDEFEEVVRREADALRRYAFTLTRNDWLADDVVQESFLRAWRYWESYRGESTRQAWLIRICRNVAFSMLRKQLPTTALSNDHDHPSTPYESMVDLADELAGLSIEHREVIVLVDVLGYDYATVADIVDCPIGTIRSRISRARDSLRQLRRESA
jgi:RNA polymerase sigma-70 factor (ECF subfamily)